MIRNIILSPSRPALNVYRDGSSPHGPTNYVLIGLHEPDLNTQPGDLPQADKRVPITRRVSSRTPAQMLSEPMPAHDRPLAHLLSQEARRTFR